MLQVFLPYRHIFYTRSRHAIAHSHIQGNQKSVRVQQLRVGASPAYSRTMALGPTQSPTEMSTRNLPGGKGHILQPLILILLFIYDFPEMKLSPNFFFNSGL
jgi:hypothetical protein